MFFCCVWNAFFDVFIARFVRRFRPVGLFGKYGKVANLLMY